MCQVGRGMPVWFTDWRRGLLLPGTPRCPSILPSFNDPNILRHVKPSLQGSRRPQILEEVLTSDFSVFLKPGLVTCSCSSFPAAAQAVLTQQPESTYKSGWPALGQCVPELSKALAQDSKHHRGWLQRAERTPSAERRG